MNVYGPTEATVTSAMCRLEGEGVLKLATLPMGGPIGNAQVYLLDEQLEPVPVGRAGRAVHRRRRSWRAVTWDARELTAERFVPDPFGARRAPVPDGRLARWRGWGAGVRGAGWTTSENARLPHRAGRDRIRARKHAAVGCGGVLREDAPGDKRLVAYLVGQADGPAAGRPAPLLRTDLPDYMIPAAWVSLDKLPLTPNGKVDRKALPAPSTEERELRAPFVAPRTETELLIAQISAEALGVERVGLGDDFFKLGGHSLVAMMPSPDCAGRSAWTFPCARCSTPQAWRPSR